MLTNHHLSLLFCLFLVVSNTSAQEPIMMNCFDPECSTPFLIGEIITDLPEHSLHKSTVVEVYAQSVEESVSRVKVGERFYDVHTSFLSLTATPHQPRSMIKVKLPRLDVPTEQSNGDDKHILSLATLSSSDPLIPENAILSNNEMGIPSNHQQSAQKEVPGDQMTHHKQTFNPTKLPKEVIKPRQIAEQHLKVSPSAEDTKIHNLVHDSVDKPKYEEANGSLPLLFKSQPLKSPIESEPQSHSALEDSISQSAPNSMAESVDLYQMQKPIEDIHSHPTQTSGYVFNTEKVPRQQQFLPPLSEETTSQVNKNPEVAPPNPLLIQDQYIEIEHSLPQGTKMVLDPQLKIGSEDEFEPSKPEFISSTVEAEIFDQSDQIMIEELSDGRKKIEHSKSRRETSQSHENEQDNTGKSGNEMTPNSSIQPHYLGLEGLELKTEEKEDSLNFSLMDIATESAFFHCLLYASNGTIISPSLNSTLSTERKSVLAAIVLFFARHYFIIARVLLSKFSPTLITSLDRIFASTFHLPLVFLAAWVLFFLSTLITWLAIKLFNHLLFASFASSWLYDPSRRSLSEWFAVEENLNLLAGSLADKEEAYARLIVWSTKVSERYENRIRNHSATEARINSQFREAKTVLSKTMQENKKLKETHDALVEQLSDVKAEAAVTVKLLKEEVSLLTSRLEECTHQYEESIAENNRSSEEQLISLREDKLVLVEETKTYHLQLENATETIAELKAKISRLEGDLTARERELSSLGEAFIELKNAELLGAQKCKNVAATKTQKDGKPSSGGWEAEDEVELDEITEEVELAQQLTNEADDIEVQRVLKNILDVGRLRVALEESEKKARSVAAALKVETEMRVQFQETVDKIKDENLELFQKLRIATEDCDASKKKLEILSEYFKDRETMLQRDLGRQALTESESLEELSFLRNKQRSFEVEIKTLRDQLASARLELTESERSSRRHIAELDKRLHDNWLSTIALENVVKDLRGENSMLRQKLFSGERATVQKYLSNVPFPPPPPPPPAIALLSAKPPEMRSLSRQSEKSAGSHMKMHLPPPPPFLPFPQIPVASPGGIKFIPPPPPPPSHGIVPSDLFFSQLQQLEPNRHSSNAAAPASTAWDAFRSSPKRDHNTPGINRSVK